MRWKLDDLGEFDKLEQRLERELPKIDKWIGKLRPGMSKTEFGELLLWLESLRALMARLGYLPELKLAINQKSEKARKMQGVATDLGLRISEKTRKISHWIKGLAEPKLDEKNAKRLFRAIGDLEYGLKRSREAAKHSLSEREENIVSHKDSFGVESLTDLRTMIETEFRYELKVKSKKLKVIETQAELMALVYSPKAELREAAYRALLTKHKENLDKFFMIYRGVVKDWDFEARLRGYQSPISVRNFANDIPDEVVETLLGVCRENRDIFQKYFKIKAKLLGEKKLKRFDLYAPIEKKEKKVEFEEAKKMVLETFEDFSPKFARLAKEIFEKNHIDGKPKENKRGGAFCATVEPKIAPYIMLNHTGKTRDTLVMAHELGHGVHSLYARGHYPSSQHANLPLAETASTMAEMMVFDRMLEDKRVEKSMLMDKLADSYASILRQCYFVLFEKEAHRTISQGKGGRELSDLWLKGLKEQFGTSVEVDDIFANEWCYIPHIVETPFYCYAYSFGELLSLSLWAEYKQEKKAGKIEKILETGGSKDPIRVLKEAGRDIRRKEFWEEGFGVIREWVKRLE